MSTQSSNLIFILAVALFAMAVAIGMHVYQVVPMQDRCMAAGGVYVRDTAGYICIKVEVIDISK